MSDLAKRLREGREGWLANNLSEEAADRIEQLERELAAAKQAVQHANDHADAAIDELAAEKAMADRLYRGGVMVGDGGVTTTHEAYRKARGL